MPAEAAVRELVAKLDRLGCNPRTTRSGHESKCPSCGKGPLTIAHGAGGAVFRCYSEPAPCSREAIAAALERPVGSAITAGRPDSPMVKAALALAQRGFRVHPLAPGGKIARLEGWPDKATTDEATIRGWWRDVPNGNIGIVPGATGRVAMDLDRKDGKDGVAAFGALATEHGFSPNGTLTARTPTGGEHRFFALPPGVELGNTAGLLGEGIDSKSSRGYVVGAGSLIGGVPYTWVDPDAPILPIPEPLLKLLRATTPASLPAASTTPRKTGALVVGHTGPSWGDGLTAFDRVVRALEARGSHVKPTRGGAMAQCPAHEDHDPSLHISRKPGRVLLRDHGGCAVESILAVLGLHPGDLFDEAPQEGQEGPAAHGRPQAQSLPPHELVVTSAADLQNREFKPLRFVVPRILPEGLLLFSGASKIGKTSLLCYIGARIALGQPVFGIPVERAGVLLLLLEDPLRRIRARLAELLGDGAWPENLHVIDMFAGFPKIGQGAEEAIVSILTKHPEIKLVGVDILNRVMPEQRRGSSVYAGDVAAMKALHEIANQQHVAEMVLHHDGKAAKLNSDFVDNASGSAGLVGTADNVWNIKRARGENIAALAITGREIEEQSLALRRDGHAWHMIGTGAVADIEITEGRAEIIETFEGEWLFPSQILNKLCGDDRTARQRTERALYRLAKTGALEKDSRGRYRPVGGSR